jgi:serine/threonine protein kinase
LNEEADEQLLATAIAAVDDDEYTAVSIPSKYKQDFIDALLSNSELCDRFDNMTCINVRPDDETGELLQQGATSIVFKANDATDGRRIAVKICDTTRNRARANRMLEWESGILNLIKGRKHCPELRTPFRELKVRTSSGDEATSYFSTIYYRTDVRRLFFREENGSGICLANKLAVFISLVTSIQALHKRGICHRDIKPENFRATVRDGRTDVIAIDLGLALVDHETERKLQLFSPESIGNQCYAAPEKLCGFENDYELGFGADVYSLGCLLFELASRDLFYEQFKKLNRNCYAQILNDCEVHKTEGESLQKRLDVYHENMDRDFSRLTLPRIEETSSIPPATKHELQSLIDSMCAPDYRRRLTDLCSVKERLRTVIHMLENTGRRCAR